MLLLAAAILALGILILFYVQEIEVSGNEYSTDQEIVDMVKNDKYSVPMIPDYISWWINNVSDRYILAMFCGTSVTGIYSVAYKIPTILNSVTSIFQVHGRFPL